MNDTVTLLSRALLSAIYLASGFNKAMAITATTAYLTRLGVPKPSIVVWLTIAVELGGGILVLVGFFTRWAALALAVFTGVALYLAHKFWLAPADQYMNQFNHAFKNIAIIGGFLLLAVHGPGRYSIDGRSR